MKKVLLTTTLIAAFVLSGSSGFCGALDTLKQDIKDTGSAVKQGVKSDVQTVKDDTAKAKKNELESQKQAELKDIDSKITSKKQEIEATKNATMTETQRSLKLSQQERELKYLQDKRSTTEASYNKRIDALK